MNKVFVYAAMSVVAVIVLAIIYAFWPWSGVILALAGIAGLYYWLYNAGWRKVAKWSAVVGVILVGVFLGRYYWPWITWDSTPKATAQSPAPVVTELKVRATREWSEPVRLPMGLKVDWMPNAPVEYQIMTADEKVVTFPAETNPTIVVKSSLYPWFKFRTVDANSVVISVTHYKP